MLKPQQRLKALPLVASMLGDKLGVNIVYDAYQTACTDGKTVYLPPLSIEEDELMYWMLSGYIDHEAAHIRYTDFEVMKEANLSPVAHHLFNIIEDWRVEHELVKRYPGCKEHFNWLNKHLYKTTKPKRKRKAGGKIPPAFFVLEYILLTVNMDDVLELMGERIHSIRIIDRNWPTLRRSLDDILSQIPHRCHSTQESIDITLEILNLIKVESNKKSLSKNNKAKVDGTFLGVQTDTEARSSIGANHLSSESLNCSSEDENNTLQRGKNERDKPDNTLDALLNADENSLPKNIDEKLKEVIFRKNTKKKLSGFSMAIEADLVAESLSSSAIKEASSASRALRTRLQGLMQTKVLRRIAPSLHGRISGQLLHRVATKNPRLFQKEDEIVGIDTAVHILLDRSGSMDNDINLACTACYSVASALHGIKGVNVAVTAFPSDSNNGYMKSVFPILRHGERLTYKFDVGSYGTTPLSEALWWVARELLKQKEHRKIIVVISDGIPDDPHIASQTLTTIREFGVEVAGIAINSWSLAKFINTQENITNMTELAPAMFRILQQLLLKKEI